MSTVAANSLDDFIKSKQSRSTEPVEPAPAVTAQSTTEPEQITKITVVTDDPVASVTDRTDLLPPLDDTINWNNVDVSVKTYKFAVDHFTFNTVRKEWKPLKGFNSVLSGSTWNAFLSCVDASGRDGLEERVQAVVRLKRILRCVVLMLPFSYFLLFISFVAVGIMTVFFVESQDNLMIFIVVVVIFVASIVLTWWLRKKSQLVKEQQTLAMYEWYFAFMNRLQLRCVILSSLDVFRDRVKLEFDISKRDRDRHTLTVQDQFAITLRVRHPAAVPGVLIHTTWEQLKKEMESTVEWKDRKDKMTQPQIDVLETKKRSIQFFTNRFCCGTLD